MSNLDATDLLPVISEQDANTILDSVTKDLITPKDDNGNPVASTTIGRLRVVFGEQAPLAVHMLLLASMRGFELAMNQVDEGADRADLLVSALRRVHVPEEFGDCVADGDHYPCTTAKMLNLVGGADPNVPSLDDELKALTGEA